MSTKFSSSSPTSTKFNTSMKQEPLSYKGIPRSYGDEQIERKTRLAIAKEIKRLRSNESVHDLYYDDQFVQTFTNKKDLMKHIDENATPESYHRYDIKTRPIQKVIETDKPKKKEDNKSAKYYLSFR